MGSPRITPGRRAAIEGDLRNIDGRSRAAIAREHGVSTRTVQRYADELGLTDPWNTRDITAATAAARDHLRDRRARISARFLTECEAILDQLHGPFLVFSFGGKDNDYNEHQLAGPPTADIRNLMTSAAVAFDKHLAADKHDADTGDNAAASMLGTLADGLQAAYRHLTRDDEQPPADEQP